MQEAPTAEQISAALMAAEDACAHTRATRRRLGRRRTQQRQRQLSDARERCAEAAKPLRSYIGMVAWHDLPIEQELAMKTAMSELRYERRQIDKMLARYA